MVPETGTPSGESQRRRTLDDIRREIEAEFAPSPTATEGARLRATSTARDLDEDPDLDDDPIVIRRRDRRSTRRSNWRGYVMAGAIGCIAGQLMILTYVGVTRYGADIAKLRASFGVPRLSAPVMRADETPHLSASVRPDAAASAAAASPVDVVSSGDMTAPRDTVTPPATGSSLPAPDAVAVQTDAATAVPSAAVAPARVPDQRTDPPPPQRIGREPLRNPPPPQPPLRRPLVGPGDWVESQAQLRSALSEWLTISEFRDNALVSDAEVILGADGSTAKTRVPTKLGHRMVIREQRWERGANGWNIVDDRDVGRERR
jgi:hypothetical protein